MQAGGGDYEGHEEEEPDGQLNLLNEDGSIGEEILEEAVDDEEPYRPNWSEPDATNQQVRQVPQQIPAAGVPLIFPLLPNCLALVFKQTNCAVPSLVDSSYCRVCASRLVGICPNCSPSVGNNGSRFANAHNHHHLNAAIDSDFGFRLFRSFRDTNRKYLFWHRDLARCLRRLEYVGFIQPCTILATTAGGDEWLDVLKRCWSQQLLQSPPSYSLEMLAEVQGCQMQSVCQSAAVNLIDAICGVICDLAFTSLPSTLDVIYAAVVNKYSGCGADIPPIEIFNDMLSFLVAKRRVILSPNGCYRMASKESFAHHNHHGHHHHHHRSHRHLNRQQFSNQQQLFNEQISPNQQTVSIQQQGPSPPPNATGKDQHVSIFRRIFKKRFFGRAKSRESTPPPQGFTGDQPSTSSPPPPSTSTLVPLQPRAPLDLVSSPPFHSINSLLPYRGAGPHLVAPPQPPPPLGSLRPPGLFDCYTTGAVPSLSCSTNGSVTRSRHGRPYRSNPLKRWPPKNATANITLNSSTTNTSTSNQSFAGLSAPFSTPTSAYLSSSVNNMIPIGEQAPPMCDEGYEGGLAGGCADIIQVEEEEAEREDGVVQQLLMDDRSFTSSPSSSSWSSSGAKNEPSSSTNNKSNKNDDDNNDTGFENNSTSNNLNATCAKIVNAELDSLIERYRLIGTSSNNEDSNTKETGNLAECHSRASTGTLFSIGDYMVYSAGLMVDPELEVANSKLISAPTVEQYASDHVMTATTTVITIESDGDESGRNNNGTMLKIDAGQAIFGA